MDDRTKGAWIIHHTDKLQGFTHTPRHENLKFAGKSGVLLSALAATDEALLDRSAVEAAAAVAGVSTKLELPTLLEFLAEQQLIDMSASGTEVAVLGATTASVLEHTARMFDDGEPSPREVAALELAELASRRPQETHEVQEVLRDVHGLTAEHAEDVVSDSCEFGFVDTETLDAERVLLFNGHLFRRDNASKAKRILDALTSQETRLAHEMEAQIRAAGCVELDTAQALLGEKLFMKLHAVGMFDVSRVSNQTESVSYVTLPSAFAKYGDPLVEDAMDLAKAFVTCITYGIRRRMASHGRIRMPELLIQRLVNGQWVGPASAIGEDYKVLELKRVIETRSDGGGMFSMRLLKREVGELALQVIRSGDVSEHSVPNLSSARITRYNRPEAMRVATRTRQRGLSDRSARELLLALRTGAKS